MAYKLKRDTTTPIEIEVLKQNAELGNVPNVTTNNQTPSYTMASGNDDLVSGETLTIAFGKIAKSINSLITHIADNIRHITSTERTNWNISYTNSHTHSNKTILDNATASYTTTDKTKLNGIETGAQVNDVTGVKGDAEATYRIGNVNITKANIGLGNVPNAVDSTIGGISESTSLITSGAVNGIELGGRNLAVDTMIGCDLSGFNGGGANYVYALADDTTPSKFYAKWDIPSSSSSVLRGIYYYCDKTIKSLRRLTSGNYYTVSFYAKASVAGHVLSPGSVVESQTLISNSDMTLTTAWKKYYVVCKFIKTNKFTTCFYVYGNNIQAATIYMSSLKIERGNKSTDWTPSPEDNQAKLASKTYSGIIATANNFTSSAFYFATVRPTSWYKVWRVKYRIQATADTDNNYAGASIVEMNGCQANRLTYANFNNHYNGSYRSYTYHDLYSLTSTGYTNGYGHALAVELTNSSNPTNATYARTFIIDILETENCDVTMLDSMTLYASLAGTGSTNYNGFWQIDGYNNGLRETSDDNNYDRLLMINTRLYAGTKGIYGNQLVMQKADGFWESLTSTYSTATSKTKNTSGFLLSNILLYTSGTTVTSGNLTATWTNYDSLDNYTFQYSSNCGTTLVPYKSLYLVGTISNGLFYLDNVWWTQTLPTTDNGKVYIYLGETITTSQFSLYPTHPIYAHVNGYLRNVTDYSLMSVGITTSIEWN